MDILASDLQAKVTEYQHVIREQMAEIEKLRAEYDGLVDENRRLLDWIMGDADAHTVLQSVYTNPASSEANRVKAAAASLPFEKPKLTSVPPCLELRAESVPLKDLLASRRARQERHDQLRARGLNGLGSTEPPIEVLSIADGRYRNGNSNGSGDGDGGNGDDSKD
jgi:hypothetical protein